LVIFFFPPLAAGFAAFAMMRLPGGAAGGRAGCSGTAGISARNDHLAAV
jgi:hypothetical protein